ncbi:MAG: hypothetical protein H8M99_14000 [Gloeobacteraceae cyanobacterium ES-bin-144]|nr:hypothetical protein [Verrucomicrobiales bacterium]
MNPYGISVTHTVETYEPQDAESARLVTRGMLRERAVQLASSHGRHAHETNKSDWESAKAEIHIQLPINNPQSK